MPSSPSTSWERVSSWYATHLSQGDFLQRDVVLPQTLALLKGAVGTHLDIACGEGTFLQMFQRTYPARNAFGIDLSASLIVKARHKHIPRTEFLRDDARTLQRLPDHVYGSATCILAIQNIDDPLAMLKATHARLAPNAPLVLVMNHPCFRQPKESSWGWDATKRVQYRRVDRYLSAYEAPILAHPGQDPSLSTPSFHRSMSWYSKILADAGFVIDTLEEWTSPAVSDSGPRAHAENIAREEIPLFLGIRALR